MLDLSAGLSLFFFLKRQKENLHPRGKVLNHTFLILACIPILSALILSLVEEKPVD